MGEDRPTEPPWHGFRPAVFVLMRRIDAQAAAYDARARKLAPPAGSIPVGGAHFDEGLRRDVLWAFLRHLRRGATPALAAERALDESRAVVRSWNRAPRCATFGGRHEAERWEDTCSALLADTARQFDNIPAPPPEPAPIPDPPRFIHTGDRLPRAGGYRGSGR
jgi:hypothetical protein